MTFVTMYGGRTGRYLATPNVEHRRRRVRRLPLNQSSCVHACRLSLPSAEDKMVIVITWVFARAYRF